MEYEVLDRCDAEEIQSYDEGYERTYDSSYTCKETQLDEGDCITSVLPYTSYIGYNYYITEVTYSTRNGKYGHLFPGGTIQGMYVGTNYTFGDGKNECFTGISFKKSGAYVSTMKFYYSTGFNHSDCTEEYVSPSKGSAGGAMAGVLVMLVLICVIITCGFYCCGW
jgi:hypothetical protein